MRLVVLNVASPFAPVGPDAVGGAAQVLTQLDAAIAAAGAMHEGFVSARLGLKVATEATPTTASIHSATAINVVASTGHA